MTKQLFEKYSAAIEEKQNGFRRIMATAQTDIVAYRQLKDMIIISFNNKNANLSDSKINTSQGVKSFADLLKEFD